MGISPAPGLTPGRVRREEARRAKAEEILDLTGLAGQAAAALLLDPEVGRLYLGGESKPEPA